MNDIQLYQQQAQAIQDLRMLQERNVSVLEKIAQNLELSNQIMRKNSGSVTPSRIIDMVKYFANTSQEANRPFIEKNISPFCRITGRVIFETQNPLSPLLNIQLRSQKVKNDGELIYGAREDSAITQGTECSLDIRDFVVNTTTYGAFYEYTYVIDCYADYFYTRFVDYDDNPRPIVFTATFWGE